jgi:hypothetical protein
MSSIQDTYLNALLADAAYVELRPGIDLKTVLSQRMTQPVADFIDANFIVLSSVTTPGGYSGTGFDATVWKGKPGTEFSDKVYISFRGSSQLTDFLNDGSLALGTEPGHQVMDMINWWFRVTTPIGQQARQIATSEVDC